MHFSRCGANLEAVMLRLQFSQSNVSFFVESSVSDCPKISHFGLLIKFVPLLKKKTFIQLQKKNFFMHTENRNLRIIDQFLIVCEHQKLLLNINHPLNPSKLTSSLSRKKIDKVFGPKYKKNTKIVKFCSPSFEIECSLSLACFNSSICFCFCSREEFCSSSVPPKFRNGGAGTP